MRTFMEEEKNNWKRKMYFERLHSNWWKNGLNTYRGRIHSSLFLRMDAADAWPGLGCVLVRTVIGAHAFH